MIEIQMPSEIECTRQVPGGDYQRNDDEDFGMNYDIHDFTDTKSNVSVLTSLRGLLKLYKLRLGDSDRRILSGGFQQLLNRNPELAKQIVEEQPTSESQKTTFHCLPVSVKLHIFSYLDSTDLCRAAPVSQEWYCLTSDQVLWQNLLRRDVHHWSTISHVTNPAIYKEVGSEMSSKEIYLRCSPKSSSHYKRNLFYLNNLSSMFKSLIWPHTPRVTMFGPALDSDAHHLIGRLMYDKNGLVKLIGLVHGTPGGVGGGITLQINNKQLHLSPLYSGTKSVRENVNNNRIQNNRMLARRNHDNVEEGDDEEEYELTSSIRNLCSTLVDAFVFVVNGDAGNKTLVHDRRELFTMLNEKWSAPHIPVLVLSCVNNGAKRMPCIDVVAQLNLGKLSRPWQVVDCDTETLNGLPAGFAWLLEQSRHH